MLKQIKIVSDANPTGIGIDASIPTVFVGPNNSGKSLVLREIEQCVSNSHPNSARSLVASVTIKLPPPAEAVAMLDARLGTRTQNGQVQLIPPPPGRQPITCQDAGVRKCLSSGMLDGHTQCTFVYSYLIRLDGATRLGLIHPQKSGSINLPPTNMLFAIFRNEKARKLLRQLTGEAFGSFAVIDPTSMSDLQVKMSPREPVNEMEELSLSEPARLFFADAKPIDLCSDGVKAYTGLAAAVISGDFRILLIDEPEAFLHPPLASLLGRRLSELAHTGSTSLNISTHSAAFLMGMVQSGRPFNIVRLTYSGGKSDARLLSSTNISLLMRDPLLRSAGTLAALFHDGAIITESDGDRVLYQEVNERLCERSHGGGRGIAFLNAQNKQTVHRIAAPLRQLGVAAAMVVDLDALKKSDELKELMRGAGIPQALLESYGMLRGNIERACKDSVTDLRRDGFGRLSPADKESAEQLLEALAMYGLFLTPVGELEGWLRSLQCNKHGSKWVVEVLENLGSDPDQVGYILPDEGDVWKFIRRVVKWITDPNRKGVPIIQ